MLLRLKNALLSGPNKGSLARHAGQRGLVQVTPPGPTNPSLGVWELSGRHSLPSLGSAVFFIAHQDAWRI